MTDLRLYAPDELGQDGYPPEWHMLAIDNPLLDEADMVLPGGLKHVVRALAGHRCVRCQHPYRPGPKISKGGEWSECDHLCTHAGPYRIWLPEMDAYAEQERDDVPVIAYLHHRVEARWRILTVHHLDGNKANCRWWNLAALCQRCHLLIQGKVRMDRRWLHEHTPWFKPYVAGYYAFTLLGEDLDRETVNARLDELLALEERQLQIGDAA